MHVLPRSSRFLAPLFAAAICALLVGPVPALAHQSCGMLAAPACNGPNIMNNGATIQRSFVGTGCHSGCMLTFQNATGCHDPGSPNAIKGTWWATGSMAEDTTMQVCDFDCGARGKCTMRGSDGLPVELLNFGVD